jgi:hypothetical protein
MVSVLIGVALVAFLAGLFAFKVKSRWCPECGATTCAIQERRRMAAP